MKITPLQLVLLFLLTFYYAFGLAQPAVSAPEKAGMSTDRLHRFIAYLEEEIKTGKQPGAVLTIARRGLVVHHEAYGYSSLADENLMQKDQIFYIMSMTKPIMSVAFMMLYEEGHFLLSDPISKYLPQFKAPRVAKDLAAGAKGETVPADQEITMTQVLSHTAGFSHGGNQNQLAKDYSQAVYGQKHETITDRVNAMATLPLLGQPGEQFVYSSSPDILAVLIEHFSGQAVADFLKDRLFDPLGMEDTAYNLTKEQQKRMVQLHITNAEGQLVNSPRQMPMEGNTVHGGAAGLFSTPSDYLKFCQMLLNGGESNGQQLLSPRTIALMTMNHVGDLYDYPGLGFGLGFGVTTDQVESQSLSAVGMYCWSGAFNTQFFIDPKEELIAIIMTQTAPYSNHLWDKLVQFVYQAIVD